MTTEENKRMLALSCVVADMKAENMELEQHVQKLTDEYNKVLSLLCKTENRKDEDPSKQTQDEMQHLRDHCDMLEKNMEQLKRDCVQLLTERNEAKTHAEQCDIIQADLSNYIARFEHSEFLKIGDVCTPLDSLSTAHPVKVGSEECRSCRHLIKMDVSGKKCVLCAYSYDNMKAEEAQECKNTDD